MRTSAVQSQGGREVQVVGHGDAQPQERVSSKPAPTGAESEPITLYQPHVLHLKAFAVQRVGNRLFVFQQQDAVRHGGILVGASARDHRRRAKHPPRGSGEPRSVQREREIVRHMPGGYVVHAAELDVAAQLA